MAQGPFFDLTRLASRVVTLCWVELRKIRHDRTELYTRAIQPALWLLIYGEVYGIQIIWERDAGVLTKLMVTPTPRAALITGKAFASGVRSLIQGVVIVVIAAALGVSLTLNPLKLLGAATLAGITAASLLLPRLARG